MPYHYPDRNTYYRAQRAEQARINRVNAGIQRYKNSLDSSNNDFMHAKPSDFNKYAKMAKYAVYATGFHISRIWFVFFLLMVCSVFAFSQNVNEVFTFESFLDAIRDFPTLELPQFRVSDDLKVLSDRTFDYLIRSIYDFASAVSQQQAFSFLVEPALELIGALYDSQTFVGKLVITFTTPIDFVVYIVASMIQLLNFISYILGRLFILPVVPA